MRNRRPMPTRARLLAFRCAEGGVAAVEFALILPLLLLLYLGSLELSTLIAVDKRVSTVAGATGDLVARTDTTLSQAALNDYFAAAQATMAPYDASGLKQVVTAVYVAADGTATVKWSRGFNGGVARATDSAYVLPPELTAIAPDSDVIVAEASISYTPLYGYFFNTALPLYREYFYLPRFGEYITPPV